MKTIKTIEEIREERRRSLTNAETCCSCGNLILGKAILFYGVHHIECFDINTWVNHAKSGGIKI